MMEYVDEADHTVIRDSLKDEGVDLAWQRTDEHCEVWWPRRAPEPEPEPEPEHRRPMPEHRRPIPNIVGRCPNIVGLSRTASADARTSSACPEQRRPMPKHRRPMPEHRRPIPNVGRTHTQEHKSIKPHPLPPTRHMPIGRCICLVPRPCLTVVTCCCAPRVNRLRVLTWNERGRILKDSCRGMAWLHQNVPPDSPRHQIVSIIIYVFEDYSITVSCVCVCRANILLDRHLNFVI